MAAGEGFIASFGLSPTANQTSPADRHSLARPDRIRRLQPSAAGFVDSPGNASNERPWSAAALAVYSAPEASPARSTSTASAAPEISRFRRGKVVALARTPGGSSL